MEKQDLSHYPALNVLIIDDHTLVHSTIKRTLFDLGITNTFCASNAFYALRLCEEYKFHIVICSFNVNSDKDGFHLLEELKFKGYVSKRTVLIFLSADTEEALVNSVAELQPDDFWAKPLNHHQIETRLAYTLDIKKTLYNVYQAVDDKEYSKVVYFVERHLLNNKLKKYFPHLLRMKGEALLALREFEDAEAFYRELLETNKQSWVHLGFVRALIKQDKIEEIEDLLLTLQERIDTRFATYDLLAQYHIEHQAYEQAYDEIKKASALSPRNIERHKKLWDLARLTQDFEGQFVATRNMAKYAKNSIHESPEMYLHVIRSGIDFASTLSDGQSTKVIQQVEKSITDLEKSGFELKSIKEQMQVIQARLHNVKEQRRLAERLVDTHVSLQVNPSLEDNLDKVKVFHELGRREEAMILLDAVQNQVTSDCLTGQVVSKYVEHEVEQRGEVHFTAKQLNNMAFQFFQRNRFDSALKSLSQALQITPKSARVMLSMLKVLVAINRQEGLDVEQKQLAEELVEILSQAELNEKQQQSYQALADELVVKLGVKA
ncbi:hypothetical protein C2869_04845 [Saccharobesus litoralis]|uniref:Response regulatory domain-containing protein n=1 Tax=Saccharobesus litoralis TaxID=2172099 RepID=A0A2S0VNK7_9ALTE|nr:response regulator [Saccharobesus litoralis]AWB65807.1 hypothetical protein C2869_04845 [Saccharobesus litoralis]